MRPAPGSGAALRRDPRFVSFVALFNAGKFFAAHEALEALWLDIEGPEREFLQGLVQLAVALEHRSRGNRAGAAKVLARARHRLRGYGASHAGLPLGAILERAEALLEGAGGDPPRLPAAPRGAGRSREVHEVETMKRSGKSATPGGATKKARAGKKTGTPRSAAAARSASLAKSRKRAALEKSAAHGKGAGASRTRAGTKSRLARAARRPAAVKARAAAAIAARRLEALEVRRTRALAILEGLRGLYPDAHCELNHGSALELLVATILSAQCTDAQVNLSTPALFARYRTAADYASADLGEVGVLIRSTGFFNNKAKSIVALGKALVERHAGEVPRTMEELVTLPGVGRKTANVLLTEWFHEPGIAVDTHVIRLTGPVWGLTNETDPVKIEFALYELIPEADRAFFGIATIFHGRRICTARRPDCAGCSLNTICPSAFRLGVRPAV